MVYVVGVVHVFLTDLWKHMRNRNHMEEEKTHGGTKSGSCRNRGLHGRGNCGLCVFVVYVVEANVVYVKPPKTHGGGICGLCETTKNT